MWYLKGNFEKNYKDDIIYTNFAPEKPARLSKTRAMMSGRSSGAQKIMLRPKGG